MPTSNEIRQQFIDFFVQKHGHTFAPSSPVVPHNDPTLLFANAGMNQFKPYFLGTEQPPYPRAANTQKCIRAGGKHNDLDDVGKDTYHHTFFEMLGNWSFGDYFKTEAIDWAWELLVDVWGLDPNRMHATYFEGDASEGLEPDLEAKAMWEKYLPAQRIHPGNKKDNFWEMGDTGPCGPCSEIHYDGTPDMSGGDKVNADDPQVIEIWNLVFIQFNRSPSGKLESLPAKHVDTGMGFERITRLLQGKTSNYDTDVFTPIFDAIQSVTGAKPYDGGDDTLSNPADIAYRVIADHIRTLTFALSDGAHCGNDGRNYVLRSILRRAVRFGKQTFNIEEPFFYKLVPTVVKHFGESFPELAKNPQAVIDELKEEEVAFRRTLDRGIELFNRAATSSKDKTISGEDAFELYATYGFPLDLTRLMADEQGLTVDEAEFEKCWKQHQEVSKASAGKTDVTALLVELVQKNKFKATEFIGYENTEFTGKTHIQIFDLGEVTAVLADTTPFYAESGGQVGDVGTITLVDSTFNVTDTQKVGDVYFHLGTSEGDSIASGEQQVTLTVNKQRRKLITFNHTCTHMLNRALRKHVNADADQRGSLVDDEKLRFDFTQNSAVTIEQIELVEETVNADIAADMPVSYEYVPLEQGQSINGLRAVFGEKYPSTVRVVSIGPKVSDLVSDPNNEQWPGYSIEFCGGVHMQKTGDAEGFVVISEEAVAKGIRRIIGLTGPAAHQATAQADLLLARAEALKSQPVEELAAAITQITATVNEKQLPLLIKAKVRDMLTQLQAKVKEHEKQASKAAAGNVVETAKALADEANGSIIICKIPGADGKTLRTAMDVFKNKHGDNAAILLAADDGSKLAFIASVPKAMIAKGLKAGDWVKEAATLTGGGGGGRPDQAQAGGKDASKLDEALAACKAMAESKI
ncbi:MAG TPA: alanine--tRNA ligase [Phycisphaerales bacterium]|nr:alanine--tRNA ligase [Phycisphaerales bacterium]|tara:strand:+ start:61107 stop:63863 length:2757 start_codon:yes stop_codon:yes gene_type:complete